MVLGAVGIVEAAVGGLRPAGGLENAGGERADVAGEPGRRERASTTSTSRRMPPWRYCSASPVISASTVWVICSVISQRVFQAK
jgi:hypothetical protein